MGCHPFGKGLPNQAEKSSPFQATDCVVRTSKSIVRKRIVYKGINGGKLRHVISQNPDTGGWMNCSKTRDANSKRASNDQEAD